MEQDGHLKSLAERLKEKAEQERIETEKVFSGQLQTLSDNLLALSQNAVRTTSDAMAQEITNATGNLNRDYHILGMAVARKWVSMAMLGLSRCLGMTLAGWGMVEVGLWRLNKCRTERDSLKEECRTLRETVENLQYGTWGVTLQQRENGRFIVLPPGKKPDGRAWTIGERNAIRMEE